MNRAIHNVPRFPTERGLAFHTPHLVTTINLGNTRATFRTGFGFLSNHPNSGDILFLAFVSMLLDG